MISDIDIITQCVENEMLLIGSIMVGCDRPELLGEVLGIVTPADFLQADHAIIFESVVAIIRRGEMPQGTVVINDLERRKLFDEVGGRDYLAEIIGSVPHCALAVSYAKFVREKAVLRRIISLCTDMIRITREATKEDRATELCRRLADRAALLASEGAIDPVVALVDAAFKVGARRKNPNVRRVQTGIDALDVMIGGFAKSKMTLIAADPRVGKSALIKQILLNAARKGTPVGLVTIEEDQEKVAENMLANQSEIPNHAIAHSKLTDDQWEQIEAATVKLSIPFYIDDVQSHVADVVSAVERLATKYKCQIVAVDHLHLISVDAQNREREVSKISKALKAAFKRCNVAGVVACQLNRGADSKAKPVLKNLRDSGNLEADGDCVLLLYRGDVIHYQEEGFTPTHILEVNVAKNKDGGMGEIPLACNMSLQYIGQKAEKDIFE